jgi:hypothetical protein
MHVVTQSRCSALLLLRSRKAKGINVEKLKMNFENERHILHLKLMKPKCQDLENIGALLSVPAIQIYASQKNSINLMIEKPF